MDHEVDLGAEGGFQGEPGVGKEIGPAPSLLYPRSRRQIEPEMRIGKQQYLCHRCSVLSRARVRARARSRIPCSITLADYDDDVATTVHAAMQAIMAACCASTMACTARKLAAVLAPSSFPIL